MKKINHDNNEMKKINELINIILYLNDNNKYEKLKCAHEESIKKSNEMIDEVPDNIDEFIRNSK